MKTRNLHFSAKLRQYRHLAKTINRAVKDGSFQLLSAARRRQMLDKLRERLRRIAPVVSQKQLKHALAGVAMLLGVGLAAPAAAQSFGPQIESPFGLPNTPGISFETLADIDGDGDFDFFNLEIDYASYAKKVAFYENTGTPQSPVFSADNVVDNPFGIQTPEYVTTMVFADTDSDGDLDLWIGRYEYGGFFFFENTGTANAPAFAAPQLNPFGLTSGNQFDIPQFVDIDGDGDLDLLSTEYYGGIRFFENTGTPTAPAFAAPSADFFGFTGDPSPGYLLAPVFSDFDNDGDFDLLYSNTILYSSQFVFVENMGTASAPSFGAGVANPFGLSSAGLTLGFPALADIDNDGDDDLFANDGSYYTGGLTYFYENLTIDDNSAPSSADASITIQEDEPHAFTPDDFPFIDGDLSDLLAAVQVTALPTEGSLTLNGSPVSVGQEVPVASFGNFVYTPALNAFGNDYDSFDFKVSDGQFLSADSYTLNIDVTPVNDFPTSDDAEINILASGTYDFDGSEFPFTDVDGDDLGQVQVTQTVGKGTLKFNGNNVTNGQLIPGGQLDQLSYTPIFGEEGVPYTNFKFKVSDGTVFAPTTYTMTINITGPNAATDRDLDAELRLSPNPVTSFAQLWVSSDQALNDLQYAVYDAQGQQLAMANLARQGRQATAQIDVRDYPAGLYLVQVFAEGKSKTMRFVKG